MIRKLKQCARSLGSRLGLCAPTGASAIALTKPLAPPPVNSTKPAGSLWRGLLAVFALAVAAAPSAQAYTLQPLNPAVLFSTTAYRLSGGSYLNTFRQYLGTAGANILGEQGLAAYASTANPLLPLTADAYFINLPAANNANAYSAADISALTRLYESGKPVLVVSFGGSGSSSNWAPANAKLATLVGGTLTTNRDGAATQNVTVLHPITEGVASVRIANLAGIMNPNAGSVGIGLTSDGGLTLWGERGNFLILLGFNAICDISNNITTNSRLANNIVAWLGSDLSNKTLVWFNALGGTPNSFAYLTQGTSYVAPTTPKRPGYIFRGWSLTENGTTPITGPVATASAHTVWAIWESNPNAWTLQPLNPATIYDQTVILPNGIDFSGVKGCFEDQEAVVLNAESLASYESAPLAADAYFINLAMNGSSPSANEVNALTRIFNSGKPVMFVGENNVFRTWSNTALSLVGGSHAGQVAGSSTTWQNTIPNVNNIITKNVQSVAFAGPGVAATPPANTGKWLTSQGTVSLWGAQENVLIYLDMNSLASSHNYNGTGPVLFSSNVTFVQNIVEWMRGMTPTRVRVSFDSNGGTPDPIPSVDVVVGEAYANLPEVTRTDFTFLGWYDAVTGGNLITNGTEIVINSSHTLTARWLGSPVSVYYLGNGGDPNYTAGTNERVGGEYNFPNVTRVGHSLAGWSLSDVGGELIESPYTITNTAGHFVYAQWNTNLVTVSFVNLSGIVVGNPSSTVYYGSPYGAFPSAVHPDPSYTFVGWYTDPVAGDPVASTDPVLVPGLTQTLYARWSSLPQLAGSVSISGTAQYGETLTAVPSVTTPNPGAYTYTWYVDGVAQAGNSATYVVKATDIGSVITVKIESANTTGNLISSGVTAAQRQLTWGASTGSSKVYDGNTSAPGAVPALGNVVGGDVVSVSGGTASFADANVGNGKTISFSGTWTLGGANAGLYALPADQPGDASGNITKNTNGTWTPPNGGNAYTLTYGQTLSQVAPALPNGNYTFNLGGAHMPAAGDNQIFAVTFDDGNQSATGNITVNVAKAVVTVTPNAGQSKISGTADPVLTYTAGALLAGNAFSGALSRADTGGNTGGNYAITLGTLSAGGNYTINFTSGVTFAVTSSTIIQPNAMTTTRIITYTCDVPGIVVPANVVKTVVWTLHVDAVSGVTNKFVVAAGTAVSDGDYDVPVIPGFTASQTTVSALVVGAEYLAPSVVAIEIINYSKNSSGIVVPDISTPVDNDIFIITDGDGDDSPELSDKYDPEGDDFLVDVHPGNEIDHEPEEAGYPFIIPEVPGYPNGDGDGEYDYVFDPEIPAVLVIDPQTGNTNAVIHVPSGVVEVDEDGDGETDLILIPDTSTPDNPDDFFVFDPENDDFVYPSTYGDDLVDVGPGTVIGHEPDGDDYPFVVPEVPGYSHPPYDYVFDPEIPAVLVIDPQTGNTNAVIHVPSGVIEIFEDDGIGDNDDIADKLLVPDTSTPRTDDHFVFDLGDPANKDVVCPSVYTDYLIDEGREGKVYVDVTPGVVIDHTVHGDDYFIVPTHPDYLYPQYHYVFDPKVPTVLIIDPQGPTIVDEIPVPDGLAVLGTFSDIATQLYAEYGTTDELWNGPQIVATFTPTTALPANWPDGVTVTISLSSPPTGPLAGRLELIGGAWRVVTAAPIPAGYVHLGYRPTFEDHLTLDITVGGNVARYERRVMLNYHPDVTEAVTTVAEGMPNAKLGVYSPCEWYYALWGGHPHTSNTGHFAENRLTNGTPVTVMVGSTQINAWLANQTLDADNYWTSDIIGNIPVGLVGAGLSATYYFGGIDDPSWVHNGQLTIQSREPYLFTDFPGVIYAELLHQYAGTYKPEQYAAADWADRQTIVALNDQYMFDARLVPLGDGTARIILNDVVPQTAVVPEDYSQTNCVVLPGNLPTIADPPNQVGDSDTPVRVYRKPVITIDDPLNPDTDNPDNDKVIGTFTPPAADGYDGDTLPLNEEIGVLFKIYRYNGNEPAGEDPDATYVDTEYKGYVVNRGDATGYRICLTDPMPIVPPGIWYLGISTDESRLGATETQRGFGRYAFAVDMAAIDLAEAVTAQETGPVLIGTYEPNPKYDFGDWTAFGVIVTIDGTDYDGRIDSACQIYIDDADFASIAAGAYDIKIVARGLFADGEFYTVAIAESNVPIEGGDPDDEGGIDVIDPAAGANLTITAIRVYKDGDGNEWVDVTVTGCKNYAKDYALFGREELVAKAAHGTDDEIRSDGLTARRASAGTALRYAPSKAEIIGMGAAPATNADGERTFTFPKPADDRHFYHAREVSR